MVPVSVFNVKMSKDGIIAYISSGMNVLQSFGSVKMKAFALSTLCFLQQTGISYTVFTIVSTKHYLIILAVFLCARCPSGTLFPGD